MPFTLHAAWITSGKRTSGGQEQDRYGRAQLSTRPTHGDPFTTEQNSSPAGIENLEKNRSGAEQSAGGRVFSSGVAATKNGGRLFLWAENHDSPNSWSQGEGGSNGYSEENSAPVTSARGRAEGLEDGPRGRRSHGERLNGKIPSHPAQMPVGSLRQIVRLLATSSELNSLLGDPATATVWLPSQNGGPQTRLGSYQKGVNALSGEAAAEELLPWQVTGLTLDTFHTLAFLSRFTNQRLIEIPSPASLLRHARLGNDLLYWSHAAKFVLELLAGQHFLPGLIPDQSGRFWAAWQPFLMEGSMRERLEFLVAAMPPICRAYELQSLEEAPSAGGLLEQFIGALMNRAIREWSPAGAYGNEDTVKPALKYDQRRRTPSSALSPGSIWVEGLSGEAPQLQLPPQPAHQLYQQWLEWIEQLHASVADSNIQVAFALELHSGGQDSTHSSEKNGAAAADPASISNWQLHYFLQDKDDLDILIPAQKIWNENGQSIRINGRRFDQPQERLLTGLGIASRLFAPIRESLRTPRPERANLSLEDAYLFLKEIGPLLESSGFGVITPAWWAARSRSRLGLRLRLGTSQEDALSGGEWTSPGEGRRRSGSSEIQAGGGALDLNGLIQFRWELSLGNQTLSRKEFERLADMGSPLVRIGDEWLELEPAQVEAARKFIDRNQTEGRMSLLQAVGMAQAHTRGVEEDWEPVDESGPPSRVGAQRQNGAPMNRAAHPVRSAGFLFGSTEGWDFAEGLPGPELPLDAVVADGWLDAALERLRGLEQIEEVYEPEGFVGTLRPYQRRGVGWLGFLRWLGLGACLADDMGLGKTIQAIALLLHSRQQARGQGGTSGEGREDSGLPGLLICPTSVVANWRHEIERFAPGLRLLLHHGSGRLTGEKFRAALAEKDLVITSFGIARRDIDMLAAQEWSDLILDEAQNIKNPAAKQTQAVRRLTGHSQARLEPGRILPFRIALTGTPVENRLLELWSIMEFLNPGYLGKREHFRQQFVLPIERYNDDLAAAALRRLAQPFLLRRLKTDPTIISDLPEKNEMVVFCTLTQEQEALYTRVIEETMARVEMSEGVQRRGLVLSLLLKLKQVTNHPAHYLREKKPLEGRSGKLSRLTEMLEEALSIGDRALIFTQFVEMGHLLRRHLMETLGHDALFLHGGTPATKREQMVRSFQEDDNGAPIFVLSLRAGGVGVNLTRANHVFHYDRWWNPAVENQATDRAFRIGQKRSVQVYKFVVAGTLEEQIHKMIESKQNLAESIVNSGEDWLAEMDTEGLRSLIALRSNG